MGTLHLTKTTSELLGLIAESSSASGVASSGGGTETNTTIASGGTPQDAVAANANRRILQIQNKSVGDMTITVDGSTPSATNGMLLPAGAFAKWSPDEMPLGVVKIFGATTGQRYWLREG